MSVGRPEWRPIFLSEHQNETLSVLAELMIPRTDSPGAEDALVNRTIDRRVAADSQAVQQDFVASLAWIDDESRRRHGARFIDLPEERRVEFVRSLASARCDITGSAHFVNIKMWIAKAYYDSDIGMRELGWTGTMWHRDFEGCPHPPSSH